jgi:hypothetical protein
MAEYLQAPPRRKALGLLADALTSGQEALNTVNVPYLGGLGGLLLQQAPQYLQDVSYGMPAFRGGNVATGGLGTLTPDTRMLDVATLPFLGAGAAKAAQVGTRTVARPIAGLLNKEQQLAEGLLNQSNNYSGMPSSLISESGIGKAPATSPTGISTALSQRFDEAFQTTDAMPSFSVFAKPTARPLNDLTPTNSSTGLINFPTIQSPKVDKGIYQDYNTLNEIKQNILPYKENLQGFLDNYSNVLGLEPGRATTRIKDDYKIGLKLNSGKAPSEISDYLGGRLVVDKPEQAQSVLGDLQKRGNVLKIDNWLNDTGKGDGYRAIHVQLGLKNGTSTEVQLVPKQLLDVYEKYKPIYDQQKHKISGDLYGDEAVKFRKILEQAKIDRNTAWEKLKQQIE